MQSFKLDEYGDLRLENGGIKLVTGNKLLCQKVQQVLSTNLDEYALDRKQGISFKNLLGRKLNIDLVRDEILRGLRQVDPTFTLEKFECELSKTRKLNISFTAKTETGESVDFVKIY